MAELPTGTVTFLFTDVEGSTRLIQQIGDGYAEVLSAHREILRGAARHAGGAEVDAPGDAMFFVFRHADDALGAAVAAQRGLHAHPWPPDAAVRVRMGLHTGEARIAGEGYVGLDVHRTARIASAAYGGQVLLSQTTRDLVEDAPPHGVTLRDLGAHRLKDLARPERLYQAIIPDLPATFPLVASLDVVPNNLPAQVTSFVGRERELGDLVRMLGTTRCLTLTGEAGSGKTRLAVQLAAEVLEDYQGVWVVDLAVVPEPRLLPQAVAEAIGLREHAGRPVPESVVEFFRPRRALLVLDNCERMISPAAELAGTLLRACPRLRILATSREPLAVAGETVWRVPTLGVPPGGVVEAAALMQYESVRLFVERAAAAQPGFSLGPENAAAVAQICRRLDGIPLALELAAARVSALPAAQVAARLDDRFRLLTGGSRTALPHHQTLRAALDWSHDLLSDPERAMLRRASVFVGGWTLDAAETVCAGEGVPAADVLDLLTQLVNKSLASSDQERGEARFRMLDTIRQYAMDRLAEAGEAPRVLALHAAWAVALAERAEPELVGPQQIAWLDRLEVEHDNLRAALERLTAEGSSDGALRLAGAVWRYWFTRGHWNEGRDWLERALRSGRPEPTSARAKALYAAGALAWAQGDHRRSAELCGEALPLCRALGDHQGITIVLLFLGATALVRGDHQAAVARFEESLALARQIGDAWGAAFALDTLGDLARIQGEYRRASGFYEQSLEMARSLGDRQRIASALNSLGVVATAQMDFDRAERLLGESHALYRELRDRAGIAVSLHRLAAVARLQGDRERAAAQYDESLARFRKLGDQEGIAATVHGLALVARANGDRDRATSLARESLAMFNRFGHKIGSAAVLHTLGTLARDDGDDQRAALLYRGSLSLRRTIGDRRGIEETLEGMAHVAAARRPERAVRLFAAAEAMRAAAGTPMPAGEQEPRDAAMAVLRAELGEAFEAAAAQGRAMTADEAIGYALAEDVAEEAAS